jgi:hypothetical protein
MLIATIIIVGMLFKTNSKYKALIKNIKIYLLAKKIFIIKNKTNK